MDNILILITKLNGGGAERCASNLSLELSKKYNIILVVFDGSNITYPYGGKLIDLGIEKNDNFLKKVINVFKRIKTLKKIKKQYNIKCSISLLDGPNIVNVLSRKKDKVIVSVRNKLSSEKMNFFRKKIIYYCSKKADKTVALSEMVKRDLIQNFNIEENKIMVIYNHCDSNLLHKLSEGMEKPGFVQRGEIYISTIGRLNMQKGQWHLIRAFKKVTEKIPNAKLIIIGEGELEFKLKRLVNDLGMKKNIIFTGFIKNPHNILKYCEMFVFSSIFEGLGNVLLEALAFNVPIISTDCEAGPREILAPKSELSSNARDIEYEEYGILVPKLNYDNFNSYDKITKEEQIMANAIIKLHEDEELRKKYINLSKERINDFSVEKIIAEWEKCIY